MDKIEILKGLSDLADRAEDLGLIKESESITESMRKFSQYEGGLNYWISNSRAFERAWKIKREKNKLSSGIPITPEDFNSAQECWFEVLDEFQKGLLGSDEEFLSKYAKKTKNKKNKKEIEKAQDQEMTPSMERFHNKISEGPGSEGENICKNFGMKESSAKRLMFEIASRLMCGRSFGGSFYSAIDSLIKESKSMSSSIINTIDTLEKSSTNKGLDLERSTLISKLKESLKAM